jgi:hypothetical protein
MPYSIFVWIIIPIALFTIILPRIVPQQEIRRRYFTSGFFEVWKNSEFV